MNELIAKWLEYKYLERRLTDERRAIEDKIIQLQDIPESLEGVTTVKDGRYTLKITGRIDRKVDADLLQEIAAEHDLTMYLPDLFRWKPEIKMSVWRATDASITAPLAKAITAKPGRPSFAITTEE
jgi:hypothetical protein